MKECLRSMCVAFVFEFCAFFVGGLWAGRADPVETLSGYFVVFSLCCSELCFLQVLSSCVFLRGNPEML